MIYHNNLEHLLFMKGPGACFPSSPKARANQIAQFKMYREGPSTSRQRPAWASCHKATHSLLPCLTCRAASPCPSILGIGGPRLKLPNSFEEKQQGAEATPVAPLIGGLTTTTPISQSGRLPSFSRSMQHLLRIEI